MPVDGTRPLRLVMMGTGLFAEPTLERLLTGPDPVVGVFTQPDRALGAQRGSTRQIGKGMKEIAREHAMPVYQPERINTPEGVSLLSGLHPDLLVVAAYGQILSPEVLAVPNLGAINVHASLLPKYRGAAPINWAIYHGEHKTGVTIIRMSAGLDAGDMLAQEAISIGAEETAGELEGRLAILGARLATEVIERFHEGPVCGQPQDPAQVTRAPKLSKQHGLIDWSNTAEQVCRQIRAMQPWPSPYTFWHRRLGNKPPTRLLILEAHPLAGLPQSVCEAPLAGQVAAHREADQRLLVHTGESTLVEILEVQPAGKRRMPTRDYLRGQAIEPGDRFGSEILA